MTDTDDSAPAESSDDGPSYSCRECAWQGDSYHVLDNDTPGGRAVCPDGEGGLQLARDRRMSDGGAHAE